jgi:hypothetical protein
MPDVIISPILVRLLVFTATVPRRGSPLREWFLEENVALGARWKEPPRTTERFADNMGRRTQYLRFAP